MAMLHGAAARIKAKSAMNGGENEIKEEDIGIHENLFVNGRIIT